MSTVSAPRRHRARRGEGERLHEEILVAATHLLAEKGAVEAVSIRAIADAVGVTPPSIYLHFADKDELFLAVCTERFQELDRVCNAAAEGATDPLDEVRRRGEAYVRFGLSNPEQYRVLFLMKAHVASPAQVREWAALQHMVEAVQRCIDVGMIEGDAMLVTLGLWSGVHGLVSLVISMPEFPWPPADELMEHVLHSMVFGLACRGRDGQPVRPPKTRRP